LGLTLPLFEDLIENPARRAAWRLDLKYGGERRRDIIDHNWAVILRENAKNRAFYGGEKSTAVSIYHARNNYSGLRRK
jgi:hypothetical protein